MVNSDGQLYTIEGIAAGILMITTAYLILSTTSIFTVGDTHISDMQAEQLGNDAIAMMDFPQTPKGDTALEIYIAKNDTSSKDMFNSTLLGYLNSKYNSDILGTTNDTLKYSATCTTIMRQVGWDLSIYGQWFGNNRPRTYGTCDPLYSSEDPLDPSGLLPHWRIVDRWYCLRC